jgi:glycosyltransferase involved in cell wall biosynthesis
VATNQQRKDWGLVFQAFASLPKEWHLWAHVNRMLDYWNLTQLVEEYGLEGRVTFSHAAHDHQLAAMYAACTVTFAPGKGEGFGFPILESQLTGTPCVAIDYAGGAELTLNKVSPLWLKPEGPCSFLRPTVWPHDLTQRLQGPMATGGEPEQWLWENVWPAWETWFKEGDVL